MLPCSTSRYRACSEEKVFRVEYQQEMQAARDRAKERERQARLDRDARRLLHLGGTWDVTEGSLLLAAMGDEEFAEMARTKPDTMQDVVERAVEFSQMESVTGRRLTPEEVAAVSDAKKELRERILARARELAADPEMTGTTALTRVKRELGREIQQLGIGLSYPTWYQSYWKKVRQPASARRDEPLRKTTPPATPLQGAVPLAPNGNGSAFSLAPTKGTIDYEVVHDAKTNRVRLSIEMPASLFAVLRMVQG